MKKYASLGKRIFAPALSVVLGLSLVPTNALAEELVQTQQEPSTVAAEVSAQESGAAATVEKTDAVASSETSASGAENADTTATPNSVQEESVSPSEDGTESATPDEEDHVSETEANDGSDATAAMEAESLTSEETANPDQGASASVGTQQSTSPVAETYSVPESVDHSDFPVEELPSSMLINGAETTIYSPQIVNRGDEIIVAGKLNINPIKARINEMGEGYEAYWDQIDVDVFEFSMIAALAVSNQIVVPSNPDCAVEDFDGLEVKDVQVDGQTVVVTMGLVGEGHSYSYRQLRDIFNGAGDESGFMSLRLSGLKVADDATPGSIGVSAGAVAGIFAATSELNGSVQSYSYAWASDYDLGFVEIAGASEEDEPCVDTYVQPATYNRRSSDKEELPKTADGTGYAGAVALGAAGLMALGLSKRLRRE